MKTTANNFLWIGLAVAVVLSLAWEFIPLNDASARLEKLPVQGLGFAGRDVPLSDTEAAVYKPARVMKRLYQVGKERVVLVAIDGSRDRHAVHDPLYCFHGAGWNVVTSRDVAVSGGSAKLLTLKKNDRTVEAVFWFSDGTERHTSVLRYWLQTTLRRLTLGCSGEEPLLVILQPLTGTTLRWDRLLVCFPLLFEF